MFSLDKFFRVSQEVTLPNGDVVTCRVLSDIEMNARSAYALSKSVEMTSSLRDPESDEYKLRIAPLVNTPTQQLIDVLVAAQRPAWVREVNQVSDFQVQFFPYPEDATPEDKVEAEIKQKNHEARVFQQKVEYLANREKALRDQYAATDRSLLAKTAQEKAIQLYANDAGNIANQHYAIWRSFERDGKPYWKSPDEVAQMGDKVITTLYSKYQEVDSQDPWELTKSESPGSAVGVGEERSGGGDSKAGGG